MKRQSPNHPAVRYARSNYFATQEHLTTRQRRKAVLQRMGVKERSMIKPHTTLAIICLFIGQGLVEEATPWAIGFGSVGMFFTYLVYSELKG